MRRYWLETIHSGRPLLNDFGTVKRIHGRNTDVFRNDSLSR